MSQSTNITHASPAWAAHADCVLEAELAEHGMPGCVEELWARQIDSSTYEICCIPFFVHGLCLGDCVGLKFGKRIAPVTKRGGHKTLRITITQHSAADEAYQSLRDWAVAAGLDHEWHDTSYFVVDLSPERPSGFDLGELERLLVQDAISTQLDPSQCPQCEAPDRRLWTMFGEHRRPVVTRVQDGDYISLERCEACGALWCGSPYEPYLSFSFLAWWPYDEARWRSLYGSDSGQLLRGWHAQMIREHYRDLPAEEVQLVEWYRVRSYGHNPIDSPQQFDAVDLE